MLNEYWMREIWTITVDLIISFRLVIHLAESEELVKSGFTISWKRCWCKARFWTLMRQKLLQIDEAPGGKSY